MVAPSLLSHHSARPVPKLALVGGLFALILAGLAIGMGFWTASYADRLAPNLLIGSVPVGGLTRESAKLLLQKRADELLTKGVTLDWNGTFATLPLGSLVGSDYIEDAGVDVAAAVDEAWGIGHGANLARSTIELAEALALKQRIPLPVTLREEALRASVGHLFGDVESPTADARFVWQRAAGAWTIKIEEGKTGRTFDAQGLLADLTNRLSSLSVVPIKVQVQVREPVVDSRIAGLAKPLAERALANAPYRITYGEGAAAAFFDVSQAVLIRAIRPTAEGMITLDRTALEPGLQAFAAVFETPPENARFRVEAGRVVAFTPSHPGLKADTTSALDGLEALLRDPDSDVRAVPLPVTSTEPEITTQNSNDFGILEPLGTGTSSYKNSPSNRIKNIRNGVRLLNGLLIAPGETFSAIAALSPFTTDNGYLSELVIKGEKIIPELGGGLCQIGTTTFRATMNSGLPVVERRNHSLVVSYYNDPANGSPGTDATIYDPAPDFKFTNDTGSHVLFVAEMIEKTKELRFTFWGKSDGRKGSYTPPIVTRWIPAGDQKDIPSPDLKPGETKCQEAHIGADASFTYTVEKADGTKVARTFDSHYRPLPKICLVGQDPNAPIPSTVPPDASLPPEALVN